MRDEANGEWVMNLVEALRTGKPLRRPIPRHLGSHGDGWLSSELVIDMLTSHASSHVWSLGLPKPTAWPNRQDILADDWEVKP
jgi:hypothetical protein